MTKAGTAAALLAPLTAVGMAQGARWIGPGSMTGSVERPSQYLETVASLALEQFGFDDLGPATDVNRQDLGGFVLATGSPEASVEAQTDPVAGAEPASPPIALLIGEAGSDVTALDFVMAEPVISAGFVLMGIESPARLKVYGTEGNVIGDYVIPSGQPGERRWIGISEDDRNISIVRVQPTSPGDYGIDDLELGLHTPEPATVLLLAWITLVRPRPIRKNMVRGPEST